MYMYVYIHVYIYIYIHIITEGCHEAGLDCYSCVQDHISWWTRRYSDFPKINCTVSLVEGELLMQFGEKKK